MPDGSGLEMAMEDNLKHPGNDDNAAGADAADIIKTERGKKFEFQLLRYVRNTFLSPYGLNYSKICENMYKYGYTEDSKSVVETKRRSLLESGDNEFGIQGENVAPFIAYGQYDVLFTRKDNKNWNQRHINMVQDEAQISGDDVKMLPGEISVASHSIALFTLAGTKYRKTGGSPGGVEVAPGDIDDDKYPFSGRISVTIRKEAYKEYNTYVSALAGENPGERGDKERFFADLLERAIVNTDVGEEALYRIHISLHSSDMEIDLRCRDAASIITLAAHICNSIYFDTHTVLSSRIKFSESGDVRFKRLPDRKQNSGDRVLFKFSCKLDTLERLNSCIETNNASADAALNSFKETINASANAALFGYYDVSLTFDFRQFNCLYPILCENRLFKDNIFLIRGIIGNDERLEPDDERLFRLDELSTKHRQECRYNDNDQDKKCSKCPVRVLMFELAHGKRSDIRSLNADYMAGLTEMTDKVKAKPFAQDGKRADNAEAGLTVQDVKRADQVNNLAEVKGSFEGIIKRVAGIRRKGGALPILRHQFMSMTGMITDLINIFLPMGMQHDLYLDWFSINDFISAFIDGVEKLVDEIGNGMALFEKTLSKYEALICAAGIAAEVNAYQYENLTSATKIEKYCERLTGYLVDLLKSGVDGINTFARLVQGVNLQFFSAANYELETRVNAKKMIIALSEYCELLSDACYGANEVNVYRRRFKALAVPNTNSSRMETRRLYPHGWIYNKWLNPGQGQPSFYSPAEQPDTHPLLMRTPGIEYFLRIYDTLPQIHHELAHHTHFFIDGHNHGCRNEFVARMAFYEIARQMIFTLFSNAGYDFNRFYMLGRNRSYRRLMRRIAGFLLSEFLEYRKAISERDNNVPEFRDVLFSHLKNVINEFICNYCVEPTPFDDASRIARKNGVDMLKNALLRYCVTDELKKRVEQFTDCAYIASADIFDIPAQEAADLLTEVVNEYDLWAASCEESAEKKGKILADMRYELSHAFQYYITSTSSTPYFSDSRDDSAARPLTADKFADRFKEKLRVFLREAAETNSGKSYLDQIDLQSLLRADEIYPEPAAQWWRLQKTVAEQLVEAAVETYNEYMSDLFMCVTIGADTSKDIREDGINELGYLFIRSVQMLKAGEDSLIMFPNEMRILRMRMVVSALTGWHGDRELAITRGRLKKFLDVKCGSLENRLVSRIEAQMESEGLQVSDISKLVTSFTKDFRKIWDSFIAECCPETGDGANDPNIPFLIVNNPLSKYAIGPYSGICRIFPALGECFNDDEKRRKLMPLDDEFKYLMNFAMLAHKINEAEWLDPLDDKFKSHIDMVYNVLTSGEEGTPCSVRTAWCDLMNAPSLEYLKTVNNLIADYYNGVYGDFKPRAMLEDSVEFVMRAYNYNHSRVVASGGGEGK